MSRMKREIASCMAGLEGSAGDLSARFVFPEGFIGFQGHFPAKKILPGVCQVQCVLTMLEGRAHRPIMLKEIKLAKFFSPVAPGEEITCLCKDVQGGDADFTVKAMLSRGEQKVSEIKLRVCYGT
ncbi:MAG TPA: hypothetical protein DCS42_15885 [Nitrospiraceae bacterium]|nr:hypothetical protein [Nitrospiraceae bacterium]HAS55500.1 hypothetical protein [Nitrospiraceae bacterium]